MYSHFLTSCTAIGTWRSNRDEPDPAKITRPRRPTAARRSLLQRHDRVSVGLSENVTRPAPEAPSVIAQRLSEQYLADNPPSDEEDDGDASSTDYGSEISFGDNVDEPLRVPAAADESELPPVHADDAADDDDDDSGSEFDVSQIMLGAARSTTDPKAGDALDETAKADEMANADETVKAVETAKADKAGGAKPQRAATSAALLGERLSDDDDADRTEEAERRVRRVQSEAIVAIDTLTSTEQSDDDSAESVLWRATAREIAKSDAKDAPPLPSVRLRNIFLCTHQNAHRQTSQRPPPSKRRSASSSRPATLNAKKRPTAAEAKKPNRTLPPRRPSSPVPPRHMLTKKPRPLARSGSPKVRRRERKSDDADDDDDSSFLDSLLAKKNAKKAAPTPE